MLKHDTEIATPSVVESVKRLQMKPQFAVLIAGSIVLSMLLVIVSMYLYNESGAAQLDLSRPGYQDVRSQAQVTERFDGIDSAGEINDRTLERFDELYSEQQAKILKQKDGFSPAVMRDDALDIKVE